MSEGLSGGPAGAVLEGVALPKGGDLRREEALLLRRTAGWRLPPGGLRVLLAGGAPAELFLHSFVLGELAEVARVESVSDRHAVRAILAGAEPPDLVLVDRGIGTEELAQSLPPRPDGSTHCLVLLTDRLGESMPVVSARGYAASVQKPLCHDRCRELIRRLFDA